MEEHIRQIAMRLKDLREVLEITAEEIADVCGMNEVDYLELECGEHRYSYRNFTLDLPLVLDRDS